MAEKNDAKYSALFKKNYDDYSSQVYKLGVVDPLEAAIKKNYEAGGTERSKTIKVSFGGSVSFNKLATANTTNNKEITYDSIDAYGRMVVDRRTMLESRKSKHAFRSSYDENVEKTITSFSRLQAASKWNTKSAIIGQFGAAGTGSAAETTVTILNTGTYRFRPFMFEEGDYVNIEKDVTGTIALQADTYEITEVNRSARTVKLKKITTGSTDLTDTSFNSQTHNIVWEHSSYKATGRKGADYYKAPFGLMDIFEFSSGQTLYGVDYQRRWSPYKNDAAGALFTTDFLNDAVEEMEERTGLPVTHIMTSRKQKVNFMNQEEGKKRYSIGTMSGQSYAGISSVASFSSLNFVSSGQGGVIPITSSRFCRDDMVVLIQNQKHKSEHVSEFEWFDDDGGVLQRTSEDSYEGRYGGYYNNFWNPFHIGFLYEFAV